MKKTILLILLSFLYIAHLQAESIEDIRAKLNKTPQTIKSSKSIYKIQSISKGRVSGWVWEGKGSAAKSILGVNVKFRINKKEKDIAVPCLYAYFYDKEKNLIKKSEEFFYYPSSRQSGKNPTFKGKITHQIQFPYSTDDKWRYVIVVMGDANDFATATIPRSLDLNEFEFDEKNIALGM